ncbi:MAG: UvrD-helicase domain-containing protein [Myxococcaceae bacterium]|nr:UvrD-helicase domain-containing protein [Myxococcaceae bacterium]
MKKKVASNQLGLFDSVHPERSGREADAQSKGALPEQPPPEPPKPEPLVKSDPGSNPAPHTSAHREGGLPPNPLRLDRNLALMAGAGTGKTHSLITLSLHLLGGAREAGAIPPQSLGLLTFTDKAAAEMRQRLYTRVDALARGAGDEPDLAASFGALGKPMPPAAYWRAIRDALGAAPIGTFHSLCVQLLREAPPGQRFSPSFELLDELAARDLLADTTDRVVLAALERGDPHLEALAREWNLAGPFGLGASLIGVLRRVREEGQTAGALTLGDERAALAHLDAALSNARAELGRVEAESAKTPKPEKREIAAAVARALEGFTLENAPERLARMREALGSSRVVSKLRGALCGENGTSVADAVAGVRVVPREHAFRRLLGEVAEAYDAALRRIDALDFTALLIEARNLLRDDPNARRLAQGRFQALLVDELQDTNRLQLELLHLLAERRDGAPRPTSLSLVGSGSVLDLPLEPAFLCVVGDRKQSIYEFRGADVSVVEQAARAIDASGGTRAFLKTSRRSSPALVAFFNHAMPRLMRDPRTQVLAPVLQDGVHVPVPTARSFEVSYVPAEDDLAAHRSAQGTAPAIERWVNPPQKAAAEELRYIDARAVARRVRELVEAKTWRGGQIALLFRRFTFVEEYRQALHAEGVPHRLVRGRGFYAAQEVMDLAALLALVADGSDATSLAIALRSPLVGLTDSSLLRLAKPGEALDAAHAIASAEPPEGFSDFERRRFVTFQALVRRLRADRHRLALRPMLLAALDATGYREAQAATAFGPQILANVEKLLELAARRDSKGPADCGGFARELFELAEANPLEAHADIVDDADADAVTLCTIHQAKGLEWPVVVLPELFASLAPFGVRARYERDIGLALKPLDTDLGDVTAPRFEKAKAERRAREEADFKRVRYVAMTRARDLLVLGVTKKGAAWADLDEACAGFAGVHERQLMLHDALPPLARATKPGSAAAVLAAARRLEGRPAPRPRSALLPVTQLQDFALCPTRYRLLHLVGLSEYPTEPRPLELEPGTAVADVRERGTHAHRLLEHVVHGRPNDLAALERDLGLPEDLEVRSWVDRFLATEFARGLSNVQRELPFVLRLEHQGFTLHLRGAIDLLLHEPGGGATIVDYKSSLRPKDGLDAYRFQLGCYVLAARAMLGDVPVRAGISFLREPDPSPELLPDGAAVDSAWLAAQAHALVTAQIDGRWQAQPSARCRALKCGYVYRCHPEGGLL